MATRLAHLSLKEREERARRLSNAYSVRNRKRLIGLGFKGGRHNPETYLKQLRYSNAWNKANRESLNAADRRYRAKIKARFGSNSDLHRLMFFAEQREKTNANRKRRANEAAKEMYRLEKVWALNRDRRHFRTHAKRSPDNTKVDWTLHLSRLPKRQGAPSTRKNRRRTATASDY